jgi:hypothetical protein
VPEAPHTAPSLNFYTQTSGANNAAISVLVSVFYTYERRCSGSGRLLESPPSAVFSAPFAATGADGANSSAPNIFFATSTDPSIEFLIVYRTRGGSGAAAGAAAVSVVYANVSIGAGARGTWLTVSAPDDYGAGVQRTPQQDNTDNAPSDNGSSDSVPVGLIVGVVVGGCVMLAAVGAVLLWRRRKTHTDTMQLNLSAMSKA